MRPRLDGATPERDPIAPRVCVVGLGRVGLSVAVALADRGVRVSGVDSDARRVAVATGRTRSDEEPGLAESLRRKPLSAGTSHADTVRAASITYVIVPTPSDDRGAYELGHVRRSFEQIGRALAGTDEPHTVVLASTVLPGATRFALLPVLERAAGRRVGDGLNLCYSPPFIALGSVRRDFLHPDFALLGVVDGADARPVQSLYERVLGVEVPVRTMSVENAELTKLAVNTFLTMKITFANTLAAICEMLPGGDVDAVTHAVGSDSRIGPRLLTGGLGFGGPCLPRDNAALAVLAGSVGVGAELARATDAANDSLTDAMVARLAAGVPTGSTAVILGLAYKSGTSVVEASPGLDLVRGLARSGLHVVGYDERGAAAARHALAADSPAGSIAIVDHPDDLPSSPDLVVLATPEAGLAQLALSLYPAVLADPWRAVSRAQWPAGTHVLQSGRPSAVAPDDPAFDPVRRLAEAAAHGARGAG